MFRLFTDAEYVRKLLVHRCRWQHFEPGKRRVYEVFLRLRPSRSSFQTRVSASRKCDSASFRPGRSSCAPLSLSVKMRWHPALLSASSCISRFWSRVDTRAYPIRIGLKFSLRRQILDTRIEEEETRKTNREWFSRTLKRLFWSILPIL